MIAHVKSELAGKRWQWMLLATVLLTNLGYGTNLALAIQCEQYYLEYLLFFTLVFGAKALLDSRKVANDIRATLLGGFQFGLMIATGFFAILWTYNEMINCPFDPILFATTRLPLILTLSAGYQLWRFQQEPKIATEALNERLLVKTLQGETKIISTEQLMVARFDQSVVRLALTDGSLLALEGSLQSLESKLPTLEFYRANRNSLIPRKLIRSYRTNEKRHMEVLMENGETIIVNKNQCRAFKDWFDALPL